MDTWHVPSSASWAPTVTEVPKGACSGQEREQGDVHPVSEIFCLRSMGETAHMVGRLDPKAPPDIKGSRIRKAAWASRRARREEVETM